MHTTRMSTPRTRRPFVRAAAVAALVAAGVVGAGLRAAGSLDFYFIDTEGGQATLVVTPAGQSLLIDAGFAGLDSNNPGKETGRDAARIAAAAKLAGVTRIDVFMPTHFHGDHVGGVEQLGARLPIDLFVDDGPAVQESVPLKQRVGEYSEIYAAQFAKGRHLVVKAGDKVALEGLDVTVVAANGRLMDGGVMGDVNPSCEGIPMRPPGNAEDTESIAVVIRFDRFRYANFGDLPWNMEIGLLCEQNKLGRVDVYQAAGHGREPTPALRALAPRIAIAANGARKGAGPSALQAFRSIPGFEDLWLLHFNVPGGSGGNPPAAFIANLEEPGGGDQGAYLKLSALEDGSFSVYNSRTQTTTAYPARR
jgi:competence protein ComEC